MNDKEYNEELELTKDETDVNEADIAKDAVPEATEEVAAEAEESDGTESASDTEEVAEKADTDGPYTLFPMDENGVFDEDYAPFTESGETTEEIATNEDGDPMPLSDEELEEYTDISEEDEEESENNANEVNETKGGNEAKPRRVDSIFDFIEICIFTLAGVFILMSFFFRYSIVDGGSMKNTLQHGERLILSSFLYTPECGDIVVVQDKSSSLKDPIVKRIIAVGGQTVKFTRTEVYVDGVELEEPYVYTGDYVNSFGANEEYRYSVYPSDALLPYVVDYVDGVYYEVLVPDGEIFVMGDHRNNSKDSREIGMLHEDAIIGKAVFRFYPFSEFGKIE